MRLPKDLRYISGVPALGASGGEFPICGREEWLVPSPASNISALVVMAAAVYQISDVLPDWSVISQIVVGLEQPAKACFLRRAARLPSLQRSQVGRIVFQRRGIQVRLPLATVAANQHGRARSVLRVGHPARSGLHSGCGRSRLRHQQPASASRRLANQPNTADSDCAQACQPASGRPGDRPRRQSVLGRASLYPLRPRL